MLCTPNSLSQEVGLALGAQAGEARIRAVTLAIRLHDIHTNLCFYHSQKVQLCIRNSGEIVCGSQRVDGLTSSHIDHRPSTKVSVGVILTPASLASENRTPLQLPADIDDILVDLQWRAYLANI